MTHQDVPTSSTIHLMYVPNHQLLVTTMFPTCTSTVETEYATEKPVTVYSSTNLISSHIPQTLYHNFVPQTMF
jgi:hypothetical protein